MIRKDIEFTGGEDVYIRMRLKDNGVPRPLLSQGYSGVWMAKRNVVDEVDAFSGNPSVSDGDADGFNIEVYIAGTLTYDLRGRFPYDIWLSYPPEIGGAFPVLGGTFIVQARVTDL